MFYHIEGTVSEILPNLAVVDCGGVGYAINTTANSLSQVSLGKTAKFYTFDYIKEDCFDLYGFTTKFPYLAWVPKLLSAFCHVRLRKCLQWLS